MLAPKAQQLCLLCKQPLALPKSRFPSTKSNLLPPFLLQYFYTIIRRLYLRSHPGSPSTLMELLLGMLAGACARLCTTPVNIITTRQQMRPGLTSLDILRGVLKTEGPAGLYAGLPASLVLTINPAITYGLFERMKSANFPEGAFARGAASKAVATIVTYPYIMAKVRLQVRDGKVYNSAMEVLGTVVKEQGLAGLYQVGLFVYLLRARDPGLLGDEKSDLTFLFVGDDSGTRGAAL